jgi:hypothetical protein
MSGLIPAVACILIASGYGVLCVHYFQESKTTYLQRHSHDAVTKSSSQPANEQGQDLRLHTCPEVPAKHNFNYLARMPFARRVCIDKESQVKHQADAQPE